LFFDEFPLRSVSTDGGPSLRFDLCTVRDARGEEVRLVEPWARISRRSSRATGSSSRGALPRASTFESSI